MLPAHKRSQVWVIRVVFWLYLLRVTANCLDSSTTTSSSSDVNQVDAGGPPPEDSDDEIKIEEDESDVAVGSSSGAYYKRNSNANAKDNAPETETDNGSSNTSSPPSRLHTALAKILELYNKSDMVQNMTVNNQQNSSDISANSTATQPVKTTVSCLPKELLLLNENDTSIVVEPTVEIVNFTKLIQDVLLINTTIKAKTTAANCTIVYFYAYWCKFSAKAAAHVNALARVFPSIRTVAIDCSVHSTVSSHFGVLSVPTILLFHNGKTIAKFNDTTFTLNKFAEFIQYYTDQKYDEKLLNVTSKDFQGPIPSTPSQERDIWLLLAWIFIIVCFVYYTSRSTLWRRVVDLVRTTWREAEAQQQHEHID